MYVFSFFHGRMWSKWQIFKGDLETFNGSFYKQICWNSRHGIHQRRFCGVHQSQSIRKLFTFQVMIGCVVPANAMDLIYVNEACIANANCLGRKLALWEARAVSNSSGAPVGAPNTKLLVPQWRESVRSSNCCAFLPIISTSNQNLFKKALATHYAGVHSL